MESTKKPLHLTVEQCVDHIVEVFGNDIRIGFPLALGKPIPLINALYNRAKANPEISLTIFTALSLEKPTWTNDLERRFLEPFVERVWGGIPDLAYMLDLRKGEVPSNICIHELYFKAGTYKGVDSMQQNFMNTNYTHTVRDCESMGNAIFSHIIAKSPTERERCYSASCNADTALETLRLFGRDQAAGKKRLRIGMVNSHLPFMYGEAEVTPDMYDVIIDTPESDFPLFSTPRLPVADADYMIGIHVSTLVKDGGTLQIGIGALGDAIAYGLNMRQNKNQAYNEVLRDSGIASTYGNLIEEIGGTGVFEKGLYGSTEMLVDAFIQLYKAGVIKRKVYYHAGIQTLLNAGRLTETIPSDILKTLIDEELIHPYLTRRDFEALQNVGVLKDSLGYADGYILEGEKRYSVNLAEAANLKKVSDHCLGSTLKNGVIASGGFFVGPRDFYDTLRGMSEEERKQFEMVGVDIANQLYGDEKLRSLQRKDGRFCNTGMKATLLGHIVSDGLEDGNIVSGVGGQYNFVAMAHALHDGRLVMMIKSTRQEGGKTLSNILYNYGHVTVPRHLRDIIVTEYGIADVRGLPDQDIIKAILNVTDSRFQEELLATAKANRKIPADYQIPEQFRENTPQRISGMLQGYKAQGEFSPFPFGTEFSRVEMVLAHALKVLKAKSAKGNEAEMGSAMKSLAGVPPEKAAPFLERMGLDKAVSPAEIQMQKTVLLAMRLAGVL